jgi:hypothetical protein
MPAIAVATPSENPLGEGLLRFAPGLTRNYIAFVNSTNYKVQSRPLSGRID